MKLKKLPKNRYLRTLYSIGFWPWLVLAGFIVLVLGFIEIGQQNAADMAECVRDGRKAYECRAIIYGRYHHE